MSDYNNGKYVCNLSPEVQERAKNELNEDSARRDEDIEILRQWITKEPHIIGRTDDAFLLKFLRISKFSIEKAKSRIDKYYTLRSTVPEWFFGCDLDLPGFRELLKTGLVLPLGYDRDGRNVVLIRIGAYDPTKYSVDDVFRAVHMVCEWMLWDDQTQICGLVVLVDLANLSGGHIAQFTPSIVKKSVTGWQDAMPFRLKGIHYFKVSPFFETIFALVKIFMKEKLQRRIKVHGCSLASLHADIPPEILPIEYGGTEGIMSSLIADLLNEMKKQQEFFLEDEKYKVDESKRQIITRTQEDLLGVDGSFRKLNID